MDDGRVIPRDVLFVPPRFVPNNDLLVSLGADLDENGWVRTDGTGAAPSVPGLWVAGNLANPRAQVITAAGEGSAAAIAMNGELVDDDVRHAVHQLRARRPRLSRPDRDSWRPAPRTTQSTQLRYPLPTTERNLGEPCPHPANPANPANSRPRRPADQAPARPHDLARRLPDPDRPEPAARGLAPRPLTGPADLRARHRRRAHRHLRPDAAAAQGARRD